MLQLTQPTHIWHAQPSSICTWISSRKKTYMQWSTAARVAYIANGYTYMTDTRAHSQTRCSILENTEWEQAAQSHRFQQLLQKWWRDEGGGKERQEGGRVIDPLLQSPLMGKKAQKWRWRAAVFLSCSWSDGDQFNPSVSPSTYLLCSPTAGQAALLLLLFSPAAESGSF